MVNPYVFYSTYSTQYKAVIDKAIALGYTLPSVNQQKLQDALMRAMISSGVFAKADLYYLMANDVGLDFARINWKNPNSNLLTDVGLISYLKNYGPYANPEVAEPSYVLPGWSPSMGVNFTLNNNCVICSTYSGYGSSGVWYRASVGPDTTIFYSLDAIRAIYNNSDAVLPAPAAQQNNVNWMNRRTASNVVNLSHVITGVVTYEINGTQVSTSRTANPLSLLGDAAAASGLNSLGQPMESFFIGGALTDPEFVSYSTALLDYLFTIRYATALFISGNYTVPAGITELFVECFGGAGAGRGYPSAAQTTTGGGGAGGAYSASLISVTPGQIIPFVIGAFGAVTTTAGGAGGDTSWNSGQILAKGGQGAGTVATTAALGGQASAGVGDIKFSGGNGGRGGTVLNSSTGSGGSGAGALGNGFHGLDAVAGLNANLRAFYPRLGGSCPALGGTNAHNGAGLSGMLGSGGGGSRRSSTGTRAGGQGGQGYIRVSATKVY